MAPRRKDGTGTNGNTGGRVKFRYADADRYLDIDMEGANDVVAEGLKSLATALTGNVVSRRTLPAKTPSQVIATNLGSEVEEPVVTTEDIDDDSAPDVPIDRDGNGEPKPKRRYAPKAPKFLSELNLTTATKPLGDFVAEKDPKETLDKYAVIGHWFKEHLSTDEVTADHIFTAYKTLGWQAQFPDEPAQPLRDLKSKRNWFDKGQATGSYKINWNGENAVNKMGAGA
jgi:hypothetical protein